MHQKIKANARKALRLHWRQALAALLCFGAAMIFLFLLEQAVFSFLEIIGDDFVLYDGFRESFYSGSGYLLVTAVFLLIRLLFVGLFSAGVKQWFLEILQEKSPPFCRVFAGFAPLKAQKLLGARLILLCRMFFIRLTALLPGLAVGYAAALTRSYTGFSAAIVGGVCGICCVVLLIAAMVLSSCYKQRYCMADYLLFAYPHISASEALRQSALMTKGFRSGIFSLKISFLPWMLLSVLVIPLFWTIPYYLSAVSVPAALLLKERPLYSGVFYQEVLL